MKCRVILFVLLTAVTETYGQDRQQLNAVYKNGQAYYERNEWFKAAAEFEKVISLDSTHRDALYKLALIHYRLGDNAVAFKLLRRGVLLNDPLAIQMMRTTFHYQLTYADTMQNIRASTQEKFLHMKDIQSSSLIDLAKNIITLTPDKKEQLQILLLWSYHNMKADSSRFFTGGNPLTTEEAFRLRRGLCDEYSNMVSEFCSAAKIPGYRVPGYVRYAGFAGHENFSQSNHAWNAVYVDSTWLLCDLFWSTTVLVTEGTSSPFLKKRLETDYFLGLPGEFIKDHLPADPVFQFSNHPIKLEAFAKRSGGIDSTVAQMNYVNYKDSLTALTKMSADDQSIAIARRAYEYNKNNPNDLIVESYNYAVKIVNNKAATKRELVKARNSLALLLAIIDSSKDDEIRSLKETSRNGLAIIDRRLQQAN
jgi:transglutaminase-like putative cysteine protease